MNAARRILLATTASLALIFTGVAGAQAAPTPATRQPSTTAVATVADSAAPSALKTIMGSYNTQSSKDLKALQASFNNDLPSGASPVVYVDWDKVATWYGMPEGPASVDQAIGDYVQAATGRRPDAHTLALLAWTMNNQGAEGGFIAKNGLNMNLVVPEYPGTSFDSFYAASFRIGGVDLLAGKTASIGMSTKEFAAFVNAHETWHGFDLRYIRDTGDGLEGAVKQNRAEMFADIGGAAEAIRNGADLTLIDKAVALRETWAYLAGPALAKTAEDNPDHYNSIVYTTQSGLLALKAHIQEVGIDNFRKLSRDQVRALDYKITDAHCLTYGQAQGLESYYGGGAAGDAAALVTELKTNAATHLRAATPAELTARQAAAATAASRGGLTEQGLFASLKTRAAELGGAVSLTSQLNARAEMTDSLRGKLADPATERVAEAQLQLLLYSNPHLVPRK